MGNLNLNLDETKPVTMDYSLLPAGWYEAWAKEAVMKRTKAGTGTYLNVQWEILEGEFANAKVFEMFNATNPNPDAVEIGMGKLSKRCKDMGMSGLVDDSAEILNKRIMLKVGIEAGVGNYEDKNCVLDSKPAAGVVKAQAQLAKVIAGDSKEDIDDVPF